jgi:hypothetical protein
MIIIGVSLLKSIIWNAPSFARRYMKVFYIISWSIPGKMSFSRIKIVST